MTVLPAPQAQTWQPQTPQSQAPHARASRHGQPWTDDDYEGLISGVRSGLDEPEIARTLGRPSSTIIARTRMLLPVEVRQCPHDRVLPAARDAFERDDYDWRTTILLTPPPRPIVTPPPVIRHGIAGLSADDLGTIAYSLASTGGTRCAELLETVCATLPNAPGSQDIARDLAARRLRRCGALIGWGEDAMHAADNWLSSADGWQPTHSSPRPYPWESESERGAPLPDWDASPQGWGYEPM